MKSLLTLMLSLSIFVWSITIMLDFLYLEHAVGRHDKETSEFYQEVIIIQGLGNTGMPSCSNIYEWNSFFR